MSSADAVSHTSTTNIPAFVLPTRASVKRGQYYVMRHRVETWRFGRKSKEEIAVNFGLYHVLRKGLIFDKQVDCGCWQFACGLARALNGTGPAGQSERLATAVDRGWKYPACQPKKEDQPAWPVDDQRTFLDAANALHKATAAAIARRGTVDSTSTST